MGRARGPAGREGVEGRPCRTPPPFPPVQPTAPPAAEDGTKAHSYVPLRRGNGTGSRCLAPSPPTKELVGGALCRAEPSHACGSCPMQGGTLRKKGEGPHNPPGMGGVAPLVEWFRATPPLRGLVKDMHWDSEKDIEMWVLNRIRKPP